ncbi:MAG: universal stress protein [Nitrospirae bacterium]|nr:universal stress protein [Nitrospirota bacterium]
MGRYKKLLVAYDGSISSKNALKQAIRLAETEKSWIKVVAVVPSYEGELDLTAVRNIKEVLKGSAEKLIKEATEVAKAEGASVMVNLEQGEAYEKIIDVAEEENCDLIVMGRRGMRALERAFMGSVTARVICHSKKDVLVIPRDAHIGFKNILLAVDGSEFGRLATERAVEFAKSYGSNLVAISVVDVTDEFLAQAPEIVDDLIKKAKTFLKDVQEKASTSNVNVETFVKEGETYTKILELAGEKKADVIFMGSHGRTGIKKLLMGSVTEKVIGHTPCPVLVVKLLKK